MGWDHEGPRGTKLESIIDVLQVGIAVIVSCERPLRPFPLRTTQTSLQSMKRPRGLWKSHRSSEKPSPSELRPEDGTPDPDGDEDGNQSAKRPKRDGSVENDDHDVSGRAERALDIDDWDDLKQLFHIVIEKYEGARAYFSTFFRARRHRSDASSFAQETSSPRPLSSSAALSTNATAFCGFTLLFFSRRARTRTRLHGWGACPRSISPPAGPVRPVRPVPFSTGPTMWAAPARRPSSAPL